MDVKGVPFWFSYKKKQPFNVHFIENKKKKKKKEVKIKKNPLWCRFWFRKPCAFCYVATINIRFLFAMFNSQNLIYMPAF